MQGLTVARASVGIAVVVAALRLLAPAPLELLDLKILDFRHGVRGPIPPSGQVVIVGIDQASLAEVGRWPWSRRQLADLIEAIDRAGPVAIGLDIVFAPPDTRAGP